MTSAQRNALVPEHDALVWKVVRHLIPKVPPYWDAEDLYGWGMIALLRALDAYQPGRSRKLESYLWFKVNFGILDSLREVNRHRRIGGRVQLDQLSHPPDIPDEAINLDRQVLAREAWDAVGQLPLRWRIMLRLYYQHHCTMRECGDALGVNESRICQMHKQALRRLREFLEAA